MAVQPADLVQPAGVLPPDWWADGHLTVWIADGENTAPTEATSAQADAITTAYAYWKAYEAMATVVLGNPDSMSLEGTGSLTTSNGRYDRLMGRAAVYRAEWSAAVDGATEVAESAPPIASRQFTMYPTF